MIKLTQIGVVAAALCAAAMPTAALADALVVRSSGPSAATYAVGRRLAPTERIVLRAGDRVVLVGEGATRTLSGPGNFPVRSANQANVDRGAILGRYLSASGGSISRTGAVRGALSGDANVPAPNLWLADVTRGGTICTLDLDNITIWNPDDNGDTLFTVESAADPTLHTSIAFVQGQARRLWPHDTMPVREGQSYRITGPGLTEPTTISFVALNNPTTDPAVVANALAEKGCMGQLAQLGERLAETATTP